MTGVHSSSKFQKRHKIENSGTLTNLHFKHVIRDDTSNKNTQQMETLSERDKSFPSAKQLVLSDD